MHEPQPAEAAEPNATENLTAATAAGTAVTSSTADAASGVVATESTATAARVAASAPARKAEQDEPETPLEALASICTVIVVGLFLMGFVFQNFSIPSGSMENTLLIGDHVVVDRATFAPPTKWAPFVHYRPVQRGDVIVFYKPNPETPDLILVKRAIGLPGDRIHLQHGVVYINGVAQNEPYALQPDSDPSRPYSASRDEFPSDVRGIAEESMLNHASQWAVDLPNHVQDGDLVVPPDSVFAMGDNRTQSLDSRYWGFVPDANIVGRPMFVYWSFETPADQEDKTSAADKFKFMVHVLTHIFGETRWSRTFHVIR